jgi:hypothetical protein
LRYGVHSRPFRCRARPGNWHREGRLGQERPSRHPEQPADFVMARKMLRGVKARAQRIDTVLATCASEQPCAHDARRLNSQEPGSGRTDRFEDDRLEQAIALRDGRRQFRRIWQPGWNSAGVATVSMHDTEHHGNHPQ